MAIHSTSAISNTRCLEFSLRLTFYLVPSAFSLTFLIYPLSQTFTVPNNFLGPFSHFWAFSHPLSRLFEWGFRMNHTVHFRHSNIIDKILFGSLFFLFFNIVQATCFHLAKTQYKKFRRAMSGFEKPRKRSSSKDVGEKCDVSCCEAKFYWDYKRIRYFAELGVFFTMLETIC